MKRLVGIVSALAILGGIGIAQAQPTPPPDASLDCRITFAYLVGTADHFGTYPGSQPSEAGFAYYTVFDPNHDNRINVADMMLASIVAGRACNLS